MKMKKTWFSYLLWLAYAGFTGVLLASCLSAWSLNCWYLNKAQTAAAVCVVFALVAGIWVGARQMLLLSAGKLTVDTHLADMWECFSALCICGGAVLYRIFLILTAYRISPLKGGLWHLLLQMAGLTVFYFAVRLLAGRIEAIGATGLLAFSPIFGDALFLSGSLCRYFLGYVLVLLLLGLYAGVYSRKEGRKGPYIVLALSGGCSGILGCFDLSGWTLLLLTGVLCIGEVLRKRLRVAEALGRLALFIGSGLLAMGILVCCVATVSGRTITGLLTVWWEANGLTAGGLGFPTGPGGTLTADTLGCLLAALGAAGFWFHAQQKQDGWILLLIALTLLDMAGMGAIGQKLLLSAVWSALAGIGAASVVTDAIEVKSAGIMFEPLESAVSGREDLSGEGGQGIMVEEITEKDALPDSVFRPIDNPLPLPKKRPKRKLDYGREVEEWEMKFDCFVDEEDDFDI